MLADIFYGLCVSFRKGERQFVSEVPTQVLYM